MFVCNFHKRPAYQLWKLLWKIWIWQFTTGCINGVTYRVV